MKVDPTQINLDACEIQPISNLDVTYMHSDAAKINLDPYKMQFR